MTYEENDKTQSGYRKRGIGMSDFMVGLNPYYGDLSNRYHNQDFTGDSKLGSGESE